MIVSCGLSLSRKMNGMKGIRTTQVMIMRGRPAGQEQWWVGRGVCALRRWGPATGRNVTSRALGGEHRAHPPTPHPLPTSSPIGSSTSMAMGTRNVRLTAWARPGLAAFPPNRTAASDTRMREPQGGTPRFALVGGLPLPDVRQADTRHKRESGSEVWGRAARERSLR
jgi:hypothetical protein